MFAINGAANGAFHRILDRTGGCSGQTTTMHIDNGTTQVWTFTNGATTGTDAAWSKQEPGTDRRCFLQTRLRENVLLQAKVCESGDGGPAVNALAGAMQKALGQYLLAPGIGYIGSCGEWRRSSLVGPWLK